jgi:FkbM family methyltransferase
MNTYRRELESLFNEPDFTDDAFFINKVLSGRNVVLYGAGESSHWFVEIIMKMYNIVPVAVLDQKFTANDKFEGIDAFSPGNYNPSDEILENAVAVISIGNRKYYDAIYDTLKNIGFKHIISLLDIYEIHNPFNLPAALDSEGKGYFIRNKNKIMQAFELLKDDLSREVFYKYLRTHFERIPVPIPVSPRDEQYFPRDIKLSKGYSRFINCGSYDGDVVRLLNEKAGKIDCLICFEPEPHIYARLSEYLKQHHDKIANSIINLPNAVYGMNDIVKFKSGFGLGSRISDDGNTVVQTVSLDNLFPDLDPTFITMDVEGVETDVLRGAQDMLERAKPDMGICVYHSPNHIWDIPLFLDKLDTGYKFYLRNYTSFCIETVLYAVAD